MSIKISEEDLQKTVAAGSANTTTESFRLLVREEVEAQVRKEHQLLKDSVAVAAKIIGAAAALFLAVFTIFGITTWSDIKKEAVTVVKTQTEELIKKSDSEANVKEMLTELVNRAVVTSYLAARAKDPDEDITLPANDWERLRNWLKSESLPLQDFRDALAVLNSQEADRKTNDANRLLAEMLNPPDKSPFSWIQQQPEKRKAILESFKDKGLGSAATDIVTSAALTESIRADAAKYIREVRYSEGVDRLLDGYSRQKDGPAKRNILVACLTLRPDHPGVIAAFKKLLSESPSSHGSLLVGEALTALPMISSRFSSELEKDAFRGLSKDLLMYAVKNEIYFSTTYFEYRFIESSRSRRDDAEPRVIFPRFQIWMSTTKGSASGVGSFSVKQFDEFEAYWKLLADSAHAGDLSAIHALLPKNDSFDIARPQYIRAEYVVSLTAGAGARIEVSEQGGPSTSVDVASLGNAAISAARARSQPELELLWLDESGRSRSATIKKIEGAGYTFALQRRSKSAKSPAA